MRRRYTLSQPARWLSMAAVVWLLAACTAAAPADVPAPTIASLVSSATPAADTAVPAASPAPTLDLAARSLDSLTRVDDLLYTMTLYGDYDVPTVTPGEARATDLRGDACSTFVARTPDGHVIMGRNFDWIHRAALLLTTDPSDGYASFSLVDIAYFGFEDGVPDSADASPLLDAPAWPFDGMNEHGLAMSLMAVPHADLRTDPARPTVDSLAIIRLVLDGAATVDEAIELMRGYNVDFGSGPDLHYLVADASGMSAVVEFVGGELVVSRSDVPWQVSTNFNLYGTDPADRPALCNRYAAADATLSESGGVLTRGDAMALLSDVAQPSTMWSVVYDLTAGEADVTLARQYESVYRFALPQP